MSTDDLTQVRTGHEIDEQRLSTYLSEHLEDFTGPVSIQQFAGGQSNPTFLVKTPARSFVLRKKPGGDLLPGAHAIEREFRVMKALGGSGVPVPRARLLCEDPTIVGTAFYLMEFIDGRVFRHASLPDVAPADRAEIYDAMNAAAAALHSADFAASGLGDFGKQGGYVSRQISLWTRQYEAAKTHEIPAIDRLVRWLPDHIPQVMKQP